MHVILKGRIPSKKNSSWSMTRGNRQLRFPSSKYTKREKEQLAALKEQEILPMGFNQPLEIQYKFWRPDNRKTDISNKLESVNDMLKRYWLLEDDNSTIVKYIKAIAMWVDKENPRCEIYIKDLSD